jgi:hypothetical protein
MAMLLFCQTWVIPQGRSQWDLVGTSSKSNPKEPPTRSDHLEMAPRITVHLQIPRISVISPTLGCYTVRTPCKPPTILLHQRSGLGLRLLPNTIPLVDPLPDLRPQSLAQFISIATPTNSPFNASIRAAADPPLVGCLTLAGIMKARTLQTDQSSGAQCQAVIGVNSEARTHSHGRTE